MSNHGESAIGARKSALRARMVAERAALPATARAEAARVIAGQLSSLAELRAAGSVLGYAAFGTEIDLAPFLESLLADGRRLCLPWVDGHALRIGHVLDLEEDLAPGWRGVREPRVGRRRETDPATIDAVVTPGLAYDRLGHRLGYGGGHFDRLLAAVRPGTFVVGVAFDVQLVDTVPVEVHDAPVDAVVTESGIIRPGAG